jgi:chorismate-pyruvate lyase
MTPAAKPASALPATSDERGPLFPLDRCYARDGLELPRIEMISPDAIPEPFQRLLVHTGDMTPTLESYHRSDIHIEVWGRARHGTEYFREVVLRLDRDERPVEFGANRIDLAQFGSFDRQLILDEYIPLGHILQMRNIPHSSRPSAFFRLVPDPLIRRALRLSGQPTLYGRRNTVRNVAGQPLSEVVEILPP